MNTKKRAGFLIVLLNLPFPASVFAEAIKFKDGRVLEARILEKTEKNVVVDFYGTRLIYPLGIIESIDGLKPASPTPPSPHLSFSTAIITYKYEGGQSGSGMVYIDAKHNKINEENSFSATSLGETKSEKHERTLYDGKVHYEIDLGKNRGISEEKIINSLTAIFDEGAVLPYYTGPEKFLGKECKMYKTPMGSYLFWNGIELREEITNHPLGQKFNYKKEAVNIQLDVVIPDEKFKVPAGIKVMTAKEAIEETQRLFKALENKLR